MLEQKRFFRASQSLMVTDGTFKLDYTTVIFVDPAAEIDKTPILLPQLLCPIGKAPVVHISTKLWLSALKTWAFTAFVFYKVV